MFQSLYIAQHHQLISVNKGISAEPAVHLPVQSIEPVADATEAFVVPFRGAAPDILTEISANAPELSVPGTQGGYSTGQVALVLSIGVVFLTISALSGLVSCQSGAPTEIFHISPLRPTPTSRSKVCAKKTITTGLLQRITRL
jgi:hypothetical protein